MGNGRGCSEIPRKAGHGNAGMPNRRRLQDEEYPTIIVISTEGSLYIHGDCPLAESCEECPFRELCEHDWCG